MRFKIRGQDIEVEDDSLLVSGTRNVYEFHFDFIGDLWDNLTGLAVFQQDGVNTVKFWTLLDRGVARVPIPLLVIPGKLKVGVYGTDGTNHVPTVWSRWIPLKEGCAPGYQVPAPVLEFTIDPETGDLIEDLTDSFGAYGNLRDTGYLWVVE